MKQRLPLASVCPVTTVPALAPDKTNPTFGIGGSFVKPVISGTGQTNFSTFSVVVTGSGTAGMEAQREDIVAALEKVVKPRAILWKNDSPSRELARAIELSARLLRFYIGKGAIPYGDHHPWIETHEDNGKCGMAAVLFNLLGEAKGVEFFSRMSVASHGPERDTGHTGNFFNLLWSIPGVAQSGPNATGAWMQEFGAWYFDLARRWDGTFSHQGPPEPDHDSYEGWDGTGGYLLAYAMPPTPPERRSSKASTESFTTARSWTPFRSRSNGSPTRPGKASGA